MSTYYKLPPFWMGLLFSLFLVLIITRFSSTSTSLPLSTGLSASNHPVQYKAITSFAGLDSTNNVKTIGGNCFQNLIETATLSQRKRKMVDLTKDAEQNSMQTLLNTWIEGSYSPVHSHMDYSEAFYIVEGSLAFFTFSESGDKVDCHILSSNPQHKEGVRVIIVEKGQWHAMTAAPRSMGYPGHAIIFETSGHKFEASKPTKTLAPFAPVGDTLNGDPGTFLFYLFFYYFYN